MLVLHIANGLVRLYCIASLSWAIGAVYIHTRLGSQFSQRQKWQMGQKYVHFMDDSTQRVKWLSDLLNKTFLFWRDADIRVAVDAPRTTNGSIYESTGGDKLKQPDYYCQHMSNVYASAPNNVRTLSAGYFQ